MQDKSTESAAAGEYPVVEWEADVDWLTQVYEASEQGERAAFRAELWQQARESAGDRRRSWGLAGFSGSSCGGVALGRRGGEIVVQVTSRAAGEHFEALTALGGRPSRLDLALTCILPAGQFHPPREAYTAPSRQSGKGRRTDARILMLTKGGGSTCYVGAASSEIRMRVYDKGAEEGSHPPGQRWRWEVQARRTRAVVRAQALAAAPLRQSAVASQVLGHVSALGLRAPGCNLEHSHHCGVHPTSDAADTLRWLERGVQPAVSRLLRHYDRATILEALGLAAPAAPGTTTL
jgi:hypothetical protein